MELLSCGVRQALLAIKIGFVHDLEVLYVGQAFGSVGERTAAERLKTHSTLQGIYYEASRLTPDQEVWLVLADSVEVRIASVDGTRTSLTTNDEDDAHIARTISSTMTEQQKINFSEAAIIRYFKPAYNTMFKDNFPNRAHKSYSECYDIDLNAVVAEVQSEPIGVRLWSPTVPPSDLHFCAFELHSPQERRSMFAF
jgi:streptogramin lyase